MNVSLTIHQLESKNSHLMDEINIERDKCQKKTLFEFLSNKYLLHCTCIDSDNRFINTRPIIIQNGKTDTFGDKVLVSK